MNSVDTAKPTIAIFYDTETTGLPLWNDPSEDPRQPHMVQLAALMVDLSTGKDLASLDFIIRPAGWEITQEMTDIHGISHEMAMDLGISEKTAAEALFDFIGNRLRIGHNESFDARILRIAAMRYFGESVADTWKAQSAECTARLTTKICNLPPTPAMRAAGRHHNKTPNLQEAHKHFFGVEFENAHSAISDVIACKKVYQAFNSLPPC